MAGSLFPSGQDAEIGGGRPGQPGTVIRRHPTTGERHMDQLVWGLLPHDVTDPVTAPRPLFARAETLAGSDFFGSAFRSRRAIVPATDWDLRATLGPRHGKRFSIGRRDGQVMAWAGLWEGHRGPGGAVTRSYCVVSVEAVEPVAGIHDRMPLILEEADWPLWLGEVEGDPATLLHPPRPDLLVLRARR